MQGETPGLLTRPLYIAWRSAMKKKRKKASLNLGLVDGRVVFGDVRRESLGAQ